MENNIIYDRDATYDPDSDMDDSESEVDGIDELALGLVYLHLNML